MSVINVKFFMLIWSPVKDGQIWHEILVISSFNTLIICKI